MSEKRNLGEVKSGSWNMRGTGQWGTAWVDKRGAEGRRYVCTVHRAGKKRAEAAETAYRGQGPPGNEDWTRYGGRSMPIPTVTGESQRSHRGVTDSQGKWTADRCLGSGHRGTQALPSGHRREYRMLSLLSKFGFGAGCPSQCRLQSQSRPRDWGPCACC